MSLHLIIARRFHPAYSLLGRGLRRLSADARQAEALFLVVLAGLGLLVLLTQFLSWALLQPVFTADPGSPARLVFWAAQLGSLLLLGLTCVLGFTPPITVACDAAGLHLRRGSQALDLAYDAIESAETVTALRFHRHWRRFAGTHVFVNRLDGDVLLLGTTQGTVALRLPETDREALLTHLAAQRTPAFAPLSASAA